MNFLRRSLDRLRAPEGEWSFAGREWPDGAPGDGWSHPSIAASQLARWPAFVDMISGTGPLGVSHEEAQLYARDPIAHNWVMTFAWALARASAGGRAVSVFDYGGGMGHYAALARALYPDWKLEYWCYDLPALAEAGRSRLPGVRFLSGDAWPDRQFDLVVASNSLQYAKDWRGLLGRLAAACGRLALVYRVPLVAGGGSFVVRQRPRQGYATEYCGWFLDRAEFLDAAAGAGLVPVREVALGPHSPVPDAPAQAVDGGYLLARGAPAADT